MHPVLHLVEAPTADLEWSAVLEVSRWNSRLRAPLEVHTGMHPTGRRVTALAMDHPAHITARFIGRWIHLHIHTPPGSPRPTRLLLRVTGRAITSPPAWEEHTRQQYTTNRRAFARATPP